MGTMVFDPSILPARMQVNLINLVGSVYDGVLASGIVDSAIDHEAEDLWETGCRNCEVAPSLDFAKFFQSGAEYLPELLMQEFPELFGDLVTGNKGAITIESVGTAELSDDYFSGTDYVPATIAIDRDKLASLMEENGVSELWDGHGSSGFVRTADADYWTVCQAVPELMEQLSSDLEKLWLVEPLWHLAIDRLDDNANEELAEKYECPVHSENGTPWAWGR